VQANNVKITRIFTAIILAMHGVFYENTAFSALATCTVSTTTPVGFGNYNPFNSSPVDTTGVLNVSCTSLIIGALVNYTVSLDSGSYGSFATRKMGNGAYRLDYNIYTDATYTTIWGDGTSGTSTNSGSCTIVLGGNCNQNFTAYASVPARQNAAVGNYSDTITVTVNY